MRSAEDLTGIQSKDIVEFLAANGVADKTQSSGLDENHVEMVQKKFKKAPAPEKKEQPVNHEAPQKEEKAQAEGQKERPKKKSSISAVYSPIRHPVCSMVLVLLLSLLK